MEEQTNTCLNCGSAEVQNYCPVCGQKAQPTRLPLKLFFHDAIESLFNIDNRWLKTLRDLFIKPGKVTREYIEGKRARYLPPLLCTNMMGKALDMQASGEAPNNREVY